jgi:hypothetical protein
VLPLRPIHASLLAAAILTAVAASLDKLNIAGDNFFAKWPATLAMMCFGAFILYRKRPKGRLAVSLYLASGFAAGFATYMAWLTLQGRFPAHEPDAYFWTIVFLLDGVEAGLFGLLFNTLCWRLSRQRAPAKSPEQHEHA